MDNIVEEIYTGIPRKTTLEEELETFEQLCNELSEESYRRVIYMKRSIREATTEELIEALSERKGIEYIETDESEQCEINITTADDALPTHRYHSAGKPGREVIMRYVPPMEGGS